MTKNELINLEKIRVNSKGLLTHADPAFQTTKVLVFIKYENQKNSISISVQDISIQNINNILEELNCGQLDSKQKKLYKKQD